MIDIIRWRTNWKREGNVIDRQSSWRKPTKSMHSSQKSVEEKPVCSLWSQSGSKEAYQQMLLDLQSGRRWPHQSLWCLGVLYTTLVLKAIKKQSEPLNKI